MESAGGKEGVANIADCPFDPPLLVTPTEGHRARLEAVVPGKGEQSRVKADRIALTFQHGAFEIVIEQDTRTTLPGGEGGEVPAQKVLHAGIEEEA